MTTTTAVTVHDSYADGDSITVSTEGENVKVATVEGNRKAYVLLDAAAVLDLIGALADAAGVV